MLIFFVKWFFFILLPSWNLFDWLSCCEVLDCFARVLNIIRVGWAVVKNHILFKLFFMDHHQLVFVIKIFINVVANFSLLRILFCLSIVAFWVGIGEPVLILLIESARLFASGKHILRFVMNWLLFKITACVSLSVFLMHVFYCVLWKSLRVFSRILMLSYKYILLQLSFLLSAVLANLIRRKFNAFDYSFGLIEKMVFILRARSLICLHLQLWYIALENLIKLLALLNVILQELLIVCIELRFGINRLLFLNWCTVTLFINIQTCHQIGTHIGKFRILCGTSLIHIRLRSELNFFSIFRQIRHSKFIHEIMSVIWSVEGRQTQRWYTFIARKKRRLCHIAIDINISCHYIQHTFLLNI